MSAGGLWPAGVCGTCGADGPLAKVAGDQHPNLCARCDRREAQPQRRCSRCGQMRTIHTRARDGAPDLCANCVPVRQGECGFCGRRGRIVRKQSEGSPALGICCYRLPVATCTDCRRERPCFHARGPEPLCQQCTRIRRAKPCVDCGELRAAHRRVEGGVICSACDMQRGGTTAACDGCGATAPLLKGLCAACQLHERVAELAANADLESAAVLAPFLRDLAAAKNPMSAMRWFYTPGFEVTRQVLAGEIPVSHQGLDDAALDARNPVAFLRAALVHSGVLEPRNEYSARFAQWQAQAVLEIAPGPDRAHVRAYATWHVAHQLAQTVQRRGEDSYASVKYARSLVSEAIKLVLWLHEQHLELRDLRQDLVDAWVAAGRRMRRRVRLFLAWLARGSVIAPLDVAWDDRLPGRRAIDDDQRFAILRRLLHERELDLRDRFAGSVLLLYGKPITRIAALRTRAVAVGPDASVTLQLGRAEIPLPEPLGAIALGLRYQQLERAGNDGWLLPGRHAGTHITADTLRQRLKRYGLRRTVEGRHAALLALAARLPAPILAERVGIHQARAAQWVRLAGSAYADYVSLRNTQP